MHFRRISAKIQLKNLKFVPSLVLSRARQHFDCPCAKKFDNIALALKIFSLDYKMPWIRQIHRIPNGFTLSENKISPSLNKIPATHLIWTVVKTS